MQVVEQLAGRASPPPDMVSAITYREARYDLSAGIAQRVDTHTLTALEQLLGAKGLQFLATFLRLAEAKQHALQRRTLPIAARSMTLKELYHVG